jgi:hypothetical protein
MNEVLKAASALPATSHTNLREIANLVAVELAYRRIDQRPDEPLAVGFPRLRSRHVARIQCGSGEPLRRH